MSGTIQLHFDGTRLELWKLPENAHATKHIVLAGVSLKGPCKPEHRRGVFLAYRLYSEMHGKDNSFYFCNHLHVVAQGNQVSLLGVVDDIDKKGSFVKYLHST